MSKTIDVLVTGATGKQGGAVARLLLDRGHRVRALTRHASSAPAKALLDAGARIVEGNLEDRDSLDRALEGADSLFAMGTPFESGEQTEVLQGKTAADAAKGAGVNLVYTSVGAADRKTGIPHFESKYEVEKHIRAIGAKAVILAPVYFMENATTFTRQQLQAGVYAMALPPERKLAQIAVADIAAAAVTALENAERFAGKRYDIAGDEISGNEAVAILSRVTGKAFSYFHVPIEMVRQTMGPDMVAMYEWFDRVGYTMDADQLRRDFPEVTWHSFERWAREQDWKAIFEG